MIFLYKSSQRVEQTSGYQGASGMLDADSEGQQNGAQKFQSVSVQLGGFHFFFQRPRLFHVFVHCIYFFIFFGPFGSFWGQKSCFYPKNCRRSIAKPRLFSLFLHESRKSVSWQMRFSCGSFESQVVRQNVFGMGKLCHQNLSKDHVEQIWFSNVFHLFSICFSHPWVLTGMCRSVFRYVLDLSRSYHRSLLRILYKTAEATKMPLDKEPWSSPGWCFTIRWF